MFGWTRSFRRETREKDLVDELKSRNIDAAYIGNQVLTILHPCSMKSVEETANYLQDEHQGQFLLWNFSDQQFCDEYSGDEREYHAYYRHFQQQVVNFTWDLPGIQSFMPQLDTMFRICYSIHVRRSFHHASETLIRP